MAARLDLVIDKGSTFERVFTWNTKNPTTGALEPVDLTGYSVRAQMREDYDSPEPFINLTVGNGLSIVENEGKITLTIPATLSSNLIEETGKWDLEVASGTYVKRLLEGRVKLRPEVTK